MDLLDVLEILLEPVIDIFVLKMPKEVCLKLIALDIQAIICLGVAFLGWQTGAWLLTIPGVIGAVILFWRQHCLWSEWLKSK